MYVLVYNIFTVTIHLPTSGHNIIDNRCCGKDLYKLRKRGIMKRLTKRNKNGIAYIANADGLTKKDQEIVGSKVVLESLYAIFQKLADYEDREEEEGE